MLHNWKNLLSPKCFLHTLAKWFVYNIKFDITLAGHKVKYMLSIFKGLLK